MTLWKSQECPQRAAFRCRRRAAARRPSALASAPLAPSVRRDRHPLAPWTRVAMPVDPHTPDLLWTAVADRIRDDLSPMVFGAWFSTTRALALDGDVLEVGVPNEFTRSWIEGHFAELVRARGDRRRPGHVGALPRRRRRARRARRPRGGRSAPAAKAMTKAIRRGPPRRAGRAAALEVHLRLVRDRQLEPLRARGGAGRRRGARAGLQPARDLRRHRPRQDAPAAGHRALRAHARARACGRAT